MLCFQWSFFRNLTFLGAARTTATSRPYVFRLSGRSVYGNNLSEYGSYYVSFVGHVLLYSKFDFSTYFEQSTLCYFAFEVRESDGFFLSPHYKAMGAVLFDSGSDSGNAVVSLS